MLINFVIDDNGFYCTNAAEVLATKSMNYLKCHFTLSQSEWQDVDAVIAIFKSATYNVIAEVLLDSNNNCYVDTDVYKNGGTIQCQLIGETYNGDVIVSTTHVSDIVEFVVSDNIIIPTPIPSKYDVFVAELEQALQNLQDEIDNLNEMVENGDFNGEDAADITDITYNDDGTVTITLEDGSTFTSTVSLKGEAGDDGEDGVGIANIAYGDDGTLTITLTDGTTFTSEYSMKGETGEAGEDGADGQTPNFTIGTVDTLPEGSNATVILTGDQYDPVLNFGIPVGATGATGATGADYVLTSIDKQEIADLLYAEYTAAEGNSY